MHNYELHPQQPSFKIHKRQNENKRESFMQQFESERIQDTV